MPGLRRPSLIGFHEFALIIELKIIQIMALDGWFVNASSWTYPVLVLGQSGDCLESSYQEGATFVRPKYSGKGNLN
jgi:hypothetical protein